MARIRIGQPEGRLRIMRKDASESGLLRLSDEQLNQLLKADMDKNFKGVAVTGDNFEIVCNSGKCSKRNTAKNVNKDNEINKEMGKMETADEIKKSLMESINTLIKVRMEKGMSWQQAADDVFKEHPQFYETYTKLQMANSANVVKVRQEAKSPMPANAFEAQLNQIAKEIATRDGISFGEALDRACMQNPQLYEQYAKARGF